MKKLSISLKDLKLSQEDAMFLKRICTLEPPYTEGKWKKLYAILAEYRKKVGGANYCVFNTGKYLLDTTNWTYKAL